MKKDIHPQVNDDVTVSCACGNTFVTQSTSPSIKVDICSKCHPFFTGKHKFIDTEGRIDKFNKKMEQAKMKAQAEQANKKAKEEKKNAKVEPISLKEALKEATK